MGRSMEWTVEDNMVNSLFFCTIHAYADDLATMHTNESWQAVEGI